MIDPACLRGKIGTVTTAWMILCVAVCMQSRWTFGVEDDLRLTPMVRAIQAAKTAVVNIQGNKTVAAENNGGSTDGNRVQTVNGLGTGIIIDSRGYVVTNLHVVQDVARIEVTLDDGTITYAKLLNFDPATDLALIKIEVDRSLPVIRIGTSQDLMQGESVIAIGNPYGYQHTVSNGIIGALHRNIPVNGTQEYLDLIQTNADINPGNSGGPLINIHGEMIGINVAVRMGAQGIGFAIPVDSAIEVIAELVSTCQRQKVSAGLSLRDVRQNKESRVEVASASETSEEGLVSLQRGDKLIRVGGRRVQSRLDLELALLGRRHGEEVEFVFDRDGSEIAQRIALNATASSSSVASKDALADAWERLGIRVVEVPESVLRNTPEKYKGGLKVTQVRPSSPAASQDVHPGDILVGALKWRTPTLSDLQWILSNSEFKSTASAKLYFVRSGTTYVSEIGKSSTRNLR